MAVAIGLVAAVPAQATFHLIKVREVFPGAGNHTGFVELQMYNEGETELAGHILTVYGPTGDLIHTSIFANGVPNGANQSTVLIGEANVGTLLSAVPDLVDPALNLPPAGGAVCWNSDGAPSDCVSWGNFSGDNQLSNSAGTPIAPTGLAPDQAILRKISRGCPTFLDAVDDSDDSATDFAINSPNPRNNATPPTEQPCLGVVPDTFIDESPALRSKSSSATFTYAAPTATGFNCKLDAAPFASCAATGRTFAGLADGTHTFQVFGENASGPDPSPASYTWTVDTVAPTSTIDTHPIDPSPGASAAFTFHPSEATLKVECSLAATGAADSFSSCASPKTYTNLADGTYIFKLRVTDLAGNVQTTPTQFTWHVDNVVADTTPPETTITVKPPDPSTSASATFGYSANEANSTFECSMDGAAFAACAAAGISYQGLTNGPHTFRVRATDPSHNVDQSPAAYTFTVAVTAPPPPPPPPPPVSAPQTLPIGKVPKSTKDSTPTFRFRSDLAGASFQCAVDKGRFRACHSPFTTTALKPGRHTVSIKALANGLSDSSPLKISFKVLKKAK